MKRRIQSNWRFTKGTMIMDPKHEVVGEIIGFYTGAVGDAPPAYLVEAGNDTILRIPETRAELFTEA